MTSLMAWHVQSTQIQSMIVASTVGARTFAASSWVGREKPNERCTAGNAQTRQIATRLLFMLTDQAIAPGL